MANEIEEEVEESEEEEEEDQDQVPIESPTLVRVRRRDDIWPPKVSTIKTIRL